MIDIRNLDTAIENLLDKPDIFRKTVLSLAMQGKITEQNQDICVDDKISEIKSTLSKNSVHNTFKKKIIPDLLEESQYKLPNGWAWIALGHLGIWSTGCGFPKEYQGQSNQELLFCKVSDMNLKGNEVEINETINSISHKTNKIIKGKINMPGTVIFPKIGGAIATHKRRIIKYPTIIDNNCSGLYGIGLTNIKWLYYLLSSIDMTKYQVGTSVPAVSQGVLNKIRIGLPSIEEQSRIVLKIESLFDKYQILEKKSEAYKIMSDKIAIDTLRTLVKND